MFRRVFFNASRSLAPDRVRAGFRPRTPYLFVFEQLLVFFDVAGDEFLQHIRRVLAGVGRDRRQIPKALFDRIAFDRGSRAPAVQFREDFRRRTLWREQAVPALRLEFAQACFRRGR